MDFHIDPLHQAPAFGDVISRIFFITVNAFDIGYHVPAQAVDVVLLEPHQGVIAQILAHFTPAIIGARLAPGCLRAAIIVKVNSPFLIFAPPVKLPQIKIAGAKVVVNDIYDDSDTMLVGRFHKSLEGIRPAVNAFNGKGMSRIVAPRKVACKLHDRHHFHGIDAQFFKIGQFFNGTIKRPRVSLFFDVKGADVHLVNDEVQHLG